jgi:hypothetical protein
VAVRFIDYLEPRWREACGQFLSDRLSNGHVAQSESSNRHVKRCGR